MKRSGLARNAALEPSLGCDEALARARDLLEDAERVVIGAGAGLSTSAGLSYSGERFRTNFQPFIARYGMSDMYSAGFYPFPTEEDRWAYWARHIWVNRYEPPALPLYRDLLDAVRNKEHFVVTTNVDAQFEKAGFSAGRVFAVQGDYGLNQCACGCHDRLYPNRGLVESILEATRTGDATHAPSELVPRCPVCGGPMAPHLRCDGHFVENADWHAAQQRYRRFLDESDPERTVLLELGVGWNTPVIIRFPFERLASLSGFALVRMNFDDASISDSGVRRGVSLQGDIAALWPRIAPCSGDREEAVVLA